VLNSPRGFPAELGIGDVDDNRSSALGKEKQGEGETEKVEGGRPESSLKAKRT